LSTRLALITRNEDRIRIEVIPFGAVHEGRPQKSAFFKITVLKLWNWSFLIVHNIGGAPEFVPGQYRYETLREAAEKIDRAVCEWSPKVEKEMMKMAERFSQKSYSERFMKLFLEYVESTYKKN